VGFTFRANRPRSVSCVNSTSKAEFVAALESGPFDMVFSDSGVADLAGKEAFALVKQLRPETFFIFVTGHDWGLVFESLRHSGANDVFSKRHLQWLGGAIGRALRAKKERPV
jgi:DNA-binding NtrC family response regulator